MKMKRRLYFPVLIALLLALVFGAIPLSQPSPAYAAPDTENLWSGSNSVSTAQLTLTSTTSADGSGTGDYAHANGLWAKATYEYWEFVMGDSAVGTGTINSITLYLKHYQSGWADDSFNIDVFDGSTWTTVQSYTEGSGPPASDTTNNWDVSATIDTWTKIDAAKVRIIGNGPVKGEDTVDWYVDTVELRVDYTPPPPTVTGITPNKGTTADAALAITNLAGTGFVTGASVELNFNGADSIAATSVTVVSATQITCNFDLSGVSTNLGAAWDVKVTNPDTQSGTGNDLFTIYLPDPTVSSITPNTGENTGSVSITDLAGTNFVNGATSVKLAKGGESDINGTSVVVVSTIKITCDFDLTGAATGDWDVVVTVTGAETPATLAAGFTVTSPTPDISNTPTSFGFGTVAESSTTETVLTHFTVTNNSGYAVNITIGGTDMTGGTTWTLSNDGTAGNMIYGLNAGLEGDSYNVPVKRDSPYNQLVGSLAGGGTTQRWGLQLLAPSTFADGGAKSGTVTLTATQA